MTGKLCQMFLRIFMFHIGFIYFHIYKNQLEWYVVTGSTFSLLKFFSIPISNSIRHELTHIPKTKNVAANAIDITALTILKDMWVQCKQPFAGLLADETPILPVMRNQAPDQIHIPVLPNKL